MNVLVVGGTSGLGLELAKKFAEGGDKVIVTGRHNPKIPAINFLHFDLSQKNLPKWVKKHVSALHPIDALVYAAGYYQEGTITDLSELEIEEMMDVCARGLVYFSKYLLEKQGKLAELITITSTSQWTPRKLEPIYNYAKAAAGHFSNSLAEDERIGKVMVIGPAGMKTPFWAGVKRDDLDEMNDPIWVAKKIMGARNDKYGYKYIRILRQPPRVEVVEKR